MMIRYLTWSILLTVAPVMYGCGECENDYDCPGNQICQAESNVCEEYVCTSDAECPPGHECTENTCRQTESRSPQPADDLILSESMSAAP